MIWGKYFLYFLILMVVLITSVINTTPTQASF